jgi:hypothetical protein
MSIAPHAANIIERNPDRRIGIARLYRQIHFKDRIARVASGDEPMMFGHHRGRDRRPEPCGPSGGKTAVEFFDGCKRIGKRSLVARGALHKQSYIIAAAINAHGHPTNRLWIGLCPARPTALMPLTLISS